MLTRAAGCEQTITHQEMSVCIQRILRFHKENPYTLCSLRIHSGRYGWMMESANAAMAASTWSRITSTLKVTDSRDASLDTRAPTSCRSLCGVYRPNQYWWKRYGLLLSPATYRKSVKADRAEVSWKASDLSMYADPHCSAARPQSTKAQQKKTQKSDEFAGCEFLLVALPTYATHPGSPPS